MKNFIYPRGYISKLDLQETEEGIKFVKDLFERKLAIALNLKRVSAPLFVTENSGLNDNLNGVERPVTFDIPDAKMEVQVVHSLAKWKRLALKRYKFEHGSGLYTDMNAIRRDELLDNLHSIYVDQWDWEKIISRDERNREYLFSVVSKIFQTLLESAESLYELFPQLKTEQPKEIKFISSQEAEDLYPDLLPNQREILLAEKYGAIFIYQIGKTLKSGKKHDNRAPDYDDWELNGDIIVWSELLKTAIELSSMGIRVDENSLKKQLEIAGCEDRMKYDFHKMLLQGELPLTIGGGIGQSRLCMYLLQKAHIGEIQVSIWQDEMRKACAENNIFLL